MRTSRTAFVQTSCIHSPIQVKDIIMTEQNTNDATLTPTADKPKRAPKKATIEHSAAIAAYAKSKDIDTVRAGKQFRAVLRANNDKYLKAGGKAHEKNAPWPAHPRKALAALFPSVPAFKG